MGGSKSDKFIVHDVQPVIGKDWVSFLSLAQSKALDRLQRTVCHCASWFIKEMHLLNCIWHQNFEVLEVLNIEEHQFQGVTEVLCNSMEQGGILLLVEQAGDNMAQDSVLNAICS